ncbi:dTDP-4-dehydrorhamnose reductase [Aureibaculum sp. 2210JD6-5]|uniref:dTDP-4-dehydrorhamnose reductase n=1 Tax=Aureibaculum sp. 2210JD6-5 TaxID=3103957 RepID=UPI002AAC4E67|nr:dTDP-4-dehydrorhamnose reductase [Aureibaculum sp. 2210JD6-5]MDY7395507.1 dTDP-4-dehydrorhamnose reductase [Aureibaculum sp. 2210JD6-5]
MEKKLVITGSNGLLGQKLVNLFSKLDDFEVIAISRGEDRNETAKEYTYYSIDITDHKKITNLLDEIRPDYIINCAAMTNVDQCEQEQEKCDEINVEALKNIIISAKKYNSHLIHISTDFIFDGENGPYSEDDEPNPINYYGLSKLKGEKLIKKSQIKYTILRTILVYGLVDNMSKKNIVSWIKNAVENKQTITIVNDQFRMPTLVDDLADACLLAIQNRAYGVFNVSSSKLLSIYEVALQVADAFNLDKSYIKSIPTSQLSQPAKRPPKTGFDLTKSQNILKLPIAPFENRLQVFKNQLLKREQ